MEVPEPNFIRAAACVVAVGVVCIVSGCGQTNEYKSPPPPTVTVEKPIEREIKRELEFTGTTRAIEAVDVRARVNGYLQEIKFEDGANVRAGDVLFIIESAPFEAVLDSAKASLQKAQASLALAEAELARTEPLVKRGALSEDELDIKKADVATAKADVAASNAAIRQAELNVGYTQVKSPLTGRVSRHLVDVGNLVMAESTLLTRVEAFDPIHAYFSVSESDVMEFIRLAQVGIANNSFKLYLGLASEKGFPHEGRLDFAELGVDPQTGTQLRRGQFPNPNGLLVPGLFARLRLPVGDPEPQILVPDRAVATDQRGNYLLVVNGENIVEYRPVQLGALVDQMRVIKDGITLNDQIVVNGIQRARPGAPVNPRPSDAQAGATNPSKVAGSHPGIELTRAQSTRATRE